MARRSAQNVILTPDGTQLFYRDWGAGKPLVFLHAWAMTCDVWQRPMSSLAGRGARCIAYDRRGHGRSSDPGTDYDYDSFADDLAAVLDQLEIVGATLIGHSMGPAEIARYLTRYGGTRISRLVLISSALPFMLKTDDNPDGIEASAFEARRELWRRDFPKWLAGNARAFVAPETSAETVAWLASLGAQASFKALMDTNHAIAETDLRADVRAITLPTLIIHGDHDQSAPLELTARKIAELVPGSELRIYEGAPHGLILTHADRLESDLAAWIGL